MSGFENIHDGMMVYGADNQPLGTIEDVKRDRIRVNGRDVSRDNIARVTADGVYVRGTGADYMQGTGTTMRDRGEMTVPKVEERLNVEKREGELGTVDIHRHVTEEQQAVPVELRREEVHVEERDVAARPVRAGEDVFQEGTIRVPVRGEEAVVEKEAVVTGEVVVSKDQTTERQEVRDTVRKQDVEVDQSQYRDARPAADAATTTPPVIPAASAARTAEAAMSPRGQVQMGLDVIGSDNAIVGRVKEVRADDFLVDRTMQRDIYVPFTAVQNVNQSGVMLTVASNEVDDQDWEKPPLF